MRSVAVVTGLLAAAVALGSQVEKPQPGAKGQGVPPKPAGVPTTKNPTQPPAKQPSGKQPTTAKQPAPVPKPADVPAAKAPPPSADELAVRQQAAAFIKAYNGGDAAALSQLFVPNAEIVDPAGNIAHGRETIQSVFAGTFKQHPKTQMEIAIHSVRMVSPGVAIEDGISTVLHEPQGAAERSRYTVVHVKQDGAWWMASARDLEVMHGAGEDHLKDLAWLIGDWVDEGAASLVATSYRWSENKKYIVSDFTVHFAGQPAMTGSQRIGWDPLAKKVRSWVFDSEGGQTEGVWTQQGNDWIVRISGTSGDGKPSFATNILTQIAKDRCNWQSRGRVKGGEPQPDVETIHVVRKPPAPKSAKH